MKSLREIIELTKSGGKPDYDELRYALVAMCLLKRLDVTALQRLFKLEKEKQYDPLKNGIEFELNECINKTKEALAKDPKEWLGPVNDPDNKIETVKKEEQYNPEKKIEDMTYITEALKHAEVNYTLKHLRK